jgi:hypothetical protein
MFSNIDRNSTPKPSGQVKVQAEQLINIMRLHTENEIFCTGKARIKVGTGCSLIIQSVG